MLKRFLNTSEYKTLEIIKKSLKDTNYRVYPNLPLYVIFANKNNEFNREERRYIQDSTFDFVVFDENSFPRLTIEFDGPVHDIFEKKKASDIKKNRICMKQRLPLLRIRDFHLKEYEKITILEYILLRFVKWNIERDQILEEVNDFFAELSEQEVKNYTMDGILDPSVDPTVIFDLKYPFPGITKIKQRISNIYGISDRNILGNKSLSKVEEDGSITYIEYRKLKTSIKMSNNSVDQDINKMFSAPINLLCLIPTEKDWDPSESAHDYFKKCGRFPVAFNDVPGLSANELAETLAEYFVLKKIENWLEKNVEKLNY